MSTSKSELQKELEQLIADQYQWNPKKFATEELAVLQTLTKLAHFYAKPDGRSSLISTVPMDSIDNIIKSGHLTLVAEKLDNSFLESIAEIVQTKHIKFTAEANGRQIHADMTALYQKSRRSLPDASFDDILFKMYAEESAFYRKMNAIICGYNDPAKTTAEEKIFALLFNVALHKAGLKKATNEMQQIPETLYRGQTFGLDEIKKKFDLVHQMKSSGTLANITPENLQKIDIASVVKKKTVSTSKDVDISSNFAKGIANDEKGFVLKIQNPSQLADFYNIANVSGNPDEVEFSARFPDDIAMIPIHMEEDAKGVTHIEAVCIRSDKVILENSQRLDHIVDSIKSKIDNLLDKKSLNKDQKNLLLSLASIFNRKPNKDMLDYTVKLLHNLYKTHPNHSLKTALDDIKRSFDDYFAIALDLKISHHNPKNIENEQKNLQKIVHGKKAWFSEAKLPDNHVLSEHFKVLSNSASTNKELYEAARNIKAAVCLDWKLKDQYPKLEQGMRDIMISIKNIEQFGKDKEEDKVQSFHL